jgi:uncharacterized membrane protein
MDPANDPPASAASGASSPPAAPAAPIFSTVLRPHRSLGPQGFLILMAAVSAVSFVAGMVFWIAGAWPVIGFFGLDVLLIYLAFRLNYRDARAAEEISLTRERLTIRKLAAGGRASVIDLDPYWVRLEVERRAEYGVTRLRLASHGRRFDIGAFLGPRERQKLAVALAAALAEVRTTPAPPAS